MVDENVGVARAGYDYAASKFSAFANPLPKTETRYAILSGNTAMAMGGAAAGVKFYCAYPMSPSTGVLHWMAAHARKAGIMVRQVEDEIGVINMAIGAAHAGVRSMCATSGGGFALMSEGLGMSAMMETPVVVIDCQRAGPSTGVPTKTEQGDLWQMLGAAFGDYPRVIGAPLDIGDCFKMIPEMFNLVDRFQCPGLVLCDLLISEGRLSVHPEDSRFQSAHRSRRTDHHLQWKRSVRRRKRHQREIQTLQVHRERHFTARDSRRGRPRPHRRHRRAHGRRRAHQRRVHKSNQAPRHDGEAHAQNDRH